MPELGLSFAGALYEHPCTAPTTERMPAVLSAIRNELMLDSSKSEEQVDKRMDDFTGVVNHIATSLNITPDCLTVSQIVESKAVFLDYLHRIKLSRHSNAQLPSNRNALLRLARKLGFSPNSFAILDEWEPLKAALPPVCSVIIHDAIERKRHPIDFSNEDLSVWADSALSAGRRLVYVRNATTTFLAGVRRSELQSQLPRLETATQRTPALMIRMDDMPGPLSSEIFEIVECRRQRAKLGVIRFAPGSASRVFRVFEILVGYAILIRGMTDVDSLRPLLIETFMTDFAFFLHNERKCLRATVVNRLGQIFTTVGCCPAFSDVDLSFAETIYSKLIKEPESALKSRRRRRYVAFRKLAAIPEQMRIERSARPHSSPESLGWRIRDELVLSCLILGQLPPYFVREAILGVNLFKAPLPVSQSRFKVPGWAYESLQQDPNATFWQFHYESKRGEVFRGLVLRQIAPLLDLYVSRYRSLLIGSNTDPGTVFFTRSMMTYLPSVFALHVGNLTRHYTGKWVPPGAIRASFAYRWRDKFGSSRDATLAKIHWVQFETISVRYNDEYRKQRALRVHQRNNRYA